VPSRGGEINDSIVRVSTSIKRRRQVIPVMVALVIGSFSVIEIVESLREETEAVLGHAHGILILSLVRLFRSIAILQTEVEEIEEACEKLLEGKEENHKDNKKSWLHHVAKFMVSTKVTIVACVLAAGASVVEVVEDLKPGAHHGAVFLALSELNYQVGRFMRTRRKKLNTTAKEGGRDGFLSRLAAMVGPLLFIAAACFAGYELYEDMKPGAHHAVAVLALAELLENVNRSKFMKYRRRRFFFFGPKVAAHME